MNFDLVSMTLTLVSSMRFSYVLVVFTLLVNLCLLLSIICTLCFNNSGNTFF